MRRRIRGVRKITHIVLHHSASDDGDVNSFRRHHVEVNGWRDVGYHYIISTSGEIQVGRPIELAGAHCIEANAFSIGVCLVGNFENYAPKEVQINSLVKLLKELTTKYSIPISNIKRHKDFSPTACPGKYYPFSDIIDKVGEVKKLEPLYDVKGHWAESDIREAYRLGLINGYPDMSFKPDNKMTRAEAVVIMMTLYRALRGE